jgi:hypothetical protein
MKKFYLILWLSIFYNSLIAQLPWLIAPTKHLKAVEPFSDNFAVVQTEHEKKGLRWRILDKQGRLSEDDYNLAYPFSNGWAAVQVKYQGDWRFRRNQLSKDNALTLANYDLIHDFKNGYAPVKKNKKWGLIDASAQLFIPIEYDKIASFSGGHAVAKKDDIIVLINKLKAEATLDNERQLKYENINIFLDGLALIRDKSGHVGYIDTMGNEVIRIKKERLFASDFSEGFAVVLEGRNNIVFINKFGKECFEFKNGSLPFEGGLSAEKEFPKKIEAINKLHPFSNGRAAVRQNGKWGFIDTLGKVGIPFEYHQVARFSEGFAAVQQTEKGTWFFIDTSGKPIRYPEGYHEDKDTVRKQWILKDITTRKTDRKYDFKEIKPCSEGVAWVRTDEGWGLLAIAEKLDIAFESPFKQGVIKPEMILNAQINSYRPLETVQWVLNGEQLPLQTLQIRKLDTLLKQKLVLKQGRNEISLTVTNAKQSRTSECVLYYEPFNGAAVAYSAVMIANKIYKNDWKVLSGDEKHPGDPISDADSLATVLHDYYQFQSIFIVQNATLAQMKATLHDLTQYKDSTARILFFYAGHGDLDETAHKAYLIPTDAQAKERKTHIEAYQVVKAIGEMAAPHVLTIFDACYAGSFVLDREGNNRDFDSKNPKIKRRTTGNAANQVRPSLTDVQPKERIPSRIVMTSGQKVTVPNSSHFLKALVGQLRENETGILDTSTLFNKIEKEIAKNETSGDLIPQRGNLSGEKSEGGDFIFRKKN